MSTTPTAHVRSSTFSLPDAQTPLRIRRRVRPARGGMTQATGSLGQFSLGWLILSHCVPLGRSRQFSLVSRV